MVSGEGRVAKACPWLGPWVVTSKLRPPRVSSIGRRGKRKGGSWPSDPNSNSVRLDSPPSWLSPPRSPLDYKGWQKPSKVAHRQLSKQWQGQSNSRILESGESLTQPKSSFLVLSDLWLGQGDIEMDRVENLLVSDLPMITFGRR